MKKFLPFMLLIILLIASCSSSKTVSSTPPDIESIYNKTITLGKERWVKFGDVSLATGSRYIFSLKPQSVRPFGIRYQLQISGADGSVINTIDSQDGDLSYYIFSPASTGTYHLSIHYTQKFIGDNSNNVTAFKGTANAYKYNRK